MNLQHFVITRFSYRTKAGSEFLVNDDPLNPKRLEYRFRLFEMICLPSVLSQTDQSFDWILIIDRQLEWQFKNRLKQLIKNRDRTYLYEYDPLVPLQDLNWLKPYIKSPDYVLTTNLDDDDAIPTNFIELTHSHLLKIEAGGVPPLKIIGARDSYQWDLTTSKTAPLGWLKDNLQGDKNYVHSCGFSLLCKYPECCFISVLGIRHDCAGSYFDWSEEPSERDVSLHRKELVEKVINKTGKNLLGWPSQSLYYDISSEVGAILTTNHIENDQVWRIQRGRNSRQKVIANQSFPNINIDWDYAKGQTYYFRPNTSSFARFLFRLSKKISDTLLGSPSSFVKRVCRRIGIPVNFSG